MSIQQFEIELDNNRTCFIPGQKVEGFLALNTLKPVQVQLLRVRIVGKVTTFLSSGTRTSNEDFSITNESSSLTMFKDFTNLLGDLAEDPVPLLPDNHVFPFSFRLPASSIPCSFEGTYGNVRYVLSATLICKGKPRRTVIQKELTVPSTMDSTDLDLIQPVQVKERGESGSFWWKSGYFDIQIDIPRGGYTSEEHVPIKITIFNHSNYGLWIKQICLKQKVTYTTVDRGPKTEKIHKLAYSEFVPHQIRDIERNIQFPIPQTKIMDPDIDTTILKVTHCIDIKIQSASKFSRPVKVQVPLVITGFPHLLFEDMRRSVDILPIYARNTEVVPAEVGDSDSSSEIEFGPAVPFQPDEDEIQVIPSVMNDSIAHSAHADVVTEGTIDLTTDRTEQDEESEESSQENEPFLNVLNRVVDLNLDESQPTSATETIRNLDYPLKIIDCHSETSSVVTAQNL